MGTALDIPLSVLALAPIRQGGTAAESLRRGLEPIVRETGSESRWDSPLRHPSHASKRRAWRRALLREEIRAVLRGGMIEREIQAAVERLLSLAASHI